ncbi:DMT family transporter [Mesobacillus subterraneus]|uniref:DMT family transporter n=1 Tax=Mesobacillus subterraneus TaxID=285983 RepID=UPI00203BDBCC|nr:DMT family transporter [Mesobacillus subterraneus]MCM3665884.1 DMT family transporter [Mesobacillus subterraneus]MCM3684725.1 DMT family transporter [Mesobacillus subterraneus]
MRGFVFALLGGAFITLQGVANSRISQDIGTWQTATITQFAGFLTALIILMFAGNGNWQRLRKVNPLYLIGGTFGAIVVFGNVTAIHFIGVTLTVSAMLISQLGMTVMIDGNGWFGINKQKMKLPQVIGITMMIAGVIVLGL